MKTNIRPFRVEVTRTVVEAYEVEARSPEEAETIVDGKVEEGEPPDELIDSTVEVMDIYESTEEGSDITEYN